jgi:hypothetical protein
MREFDRVRGGSDARHRLARAIIIFNNFRLLVFSVIQTRSVEAQNVASVLRGRTIELLDDHGRVRAQVTEEPNNKEALVEATRDSKGTIREKLGAP